MWQSSLCRNLFLDLPVGNTRGGVVVSYALKTFSHQWHQQNIVVGRRVRPGLKMLAVIKLQCGRALSTKIRLWLCKLGMQKGIYKLHML